MNALAKHEVGTRPWSAAEAFLGVILLAASVHSDRRALRMAAVDEVVRRLPILRDLGEKGRVELHWNVVRRLEAAGEDGLMQACDAIPHEMAASAYARVMDVLIDDRPLSPDDKTFLDRLETLLCLDAALVVRVRDVMAIKNRY